MIRLGQKVSFIPLEGVRFHGVLPDKRAVEGEITYINKPHRWFSVEYSDGLRTSFNFCDIGGAVTVCEGSAAIAN